jgi:NADH-quinone oxidoreductase subunit L
LSSVFPHPAVEAYDHARELLLQVAGATVSFAGIFFAYLFYYRYLERTANILENRTLNGIRKFLLAGWDFDALYDRIFVRPFVWIARVNKNDVIDRIVDGISWSSGTLHGVLSRTQTGSIRWYAMGIAAGAVVLLGIVLVFESLL